MKIGTPQRYVQSHDTSSASAAARLKSDSSAKDASTKSTSTKSTSTTSTSSAAPSDQVQSAASVSHSKAATATIATKSLDVLGTQLAAELENVQMDVAALAALGVDFSESASSKLGGSLRDKVAPSTVSLFAEGSRDGLDAIATHPMAKSGSKLGKVSTGASVAVTGIAMAQDAQNGYLRASTYVGGMGTAVGIGIGVAVSGPVGWGIALGVGLASAWAASELEKEEAKLLGQNDPSASDPTAGTEGTNTAEQSGSADGTSAQGTHEGEGEGDDSESEGDTSGTSSIDGTCEETDDAEQSSEDSQSQSSSSEEGGGTPNPLQEERSSVPLWAVTGGRTGREEASNTAKAVSMGRTGGLSEPDEGGGIFMGPTSGGFAEASARAAAKMVGRAVDGATGGHVTTPVDGEETSATVMPTHQEMKDILIKAGGAVTDPLQDGKLSGQVANLASKAAQLADSDT